MPLRKHCNFLFNKGKTIFAERWDRDNYIDIIWQNIDKGR